MFNLFNSGHQTNSQGQRNRGLETDLLMPDPHDPENEAIVSLPIHPRRSGQVRFRGSYWTARSTDNQNTTIEPDTVVYVLGRRSSILIVEPAGWSIGPASSDRPASDRPTHPAISPEPIPNGSSASAEMLKQPGPSSASNPNRDEQQFIPVTPKDLNHKPSPGEHN